MVVPDVDVVVDVVAPEKLPLLVGRTSIEAELARELLGSPLVLVVPPSLPLRGVRG